MTNSSLHGHACASHHGHLYPRTNRRNFIAGGGAAMAVGAPGPLGIGSSARTQPQERRIIDVHHHLSPPTQLAALRKENLALALTVQWTPQKSLEEMDRAGVSTSILSVTAPAVTFLGRDDARRVARESNEYAAKLVSDHPGRFGMFAVLPMPYVDDALKEIEYALDTLKADGVFLLTNYDYKWLGHPEFGAIFDQLNRRKAVLHVHPWVANCCKNLVQDVPDFVVEVTTDTTRTLASMIFSGTAAKYRDIKFIISHGGGTMPFIVERFSQPAMLIPKYKPFTLEAVLSELRRFHYDLAQTAQPAALAAVTKLIPVTNLLYGTDFPFRSAQEHVELLSAFFPQADLNQIYRGNALKLLPRASAT